MPKVPFYNDEPTQEWTVKGTPKMVTPLYKVVRSGQMWECECPSYQHRQAECKHIRGLKELDRLASEE